mgnify:CR=1 FL=1
MTYLCLERSERNGEKHESYEKCGHGKGNIFLQELKTISVSNIKHAKEKCK